jgi:peptidoglycan/LPS O-acetylase OafA/YrhL
MPESETARSLPGIQGLRAVASLLVVVHHALEESGGGTHPWRSPAWLTTAGAAGVDIFFVISGFIMLHVSFASRHSPPHPGEFLWKRIVRIYPLYLPCAFTVLTLKAAGFYAALHGLGFRDTVLSLLLLPSDQKLLGVAWTLVFEMWFYAVFAVALVSRSAAPTIVISASIIAGVILAATFAGAGFAPEFVRAFFGDTIMLEFCAGMGLGYVFLKHPQIFTKLTLAWVPAFVVIAAAPLFVPHETTGALPGPARLFVWGLPAVLILASVLLQKPGRSWWAQLWTLLGNASYAIYLTHPFVMLFYAKALNASQALAALPQAPIVLSVTLVSTALGVLVYLFFERPVMAYTRRLTSSRRST